MKEKGPSRYTPYTVYIAIWAVYWFISSKLPLPRITYSIVTVLYEMIAHQIYCKKTRRYLLEHYPVECEQAMDFPARQIYGIGDVDFNFRDFQYSMRKKRVKNPDDMLRKIYRNNNYVALFFQFAFLTSVFNLVLVFT